MNTLQRTKMRLCQIAILSIALIGAVGCDELKPKPATGFDKIKVGMTQEEVEQILKPKKMEKGETRPYQLPPRLGGQQTTSFEIVYDDSIVVEFVDGAVVAKSER